jgi:hypothetical protein
MVDAGRRTLMSYSNLSVLNLKIIEKWYQKILEYR